MGAESLKNARAAANDEFYTHYEDVEKELAHYSFEGKSVLLPCDSEDSAFWAYFAEHAEALRVKEIISVYLGAEAWCKVKPGVEPLWTPLEGNGDFFSSEIQKLVDQCDIVVTNPPFSRNAEMMDLLLQKEKDFILIGSETLLGHRLLFHYVRDGKLHYGFNSVRSFTTPDGTAKTFGNVGWFTTLPVIKVHKTGKMVAYNPEVNLPYDNYEAINVNKTVEIPCDYNGVMGVPITFLKNPDPAYEILGLACGTSRANKLYGSVPYKEGFKDKGGAPMINGSCKFERVLIKRKIDVE